MVTSISNSPAETEALGETWGREASAGLVIGLNGDLGSGKTQLVKGLARGLGIASRVHSPSFSLVNIYSGGRILLYHLDLYRLDTPAQILAAGLGEYLDPPGVAVIEWADKWFGEIPTEPRPGMGDPHRATSLPRRLRWVNFEILNSTGRRITYEDFGA